MYTNHKGIRSSLLEFRDFVSQSEVSWGMSSQQSPRCLLFTSDSLKEISLCVMQCSHVCATSSLSPEACKTSCCYSGGEPSRISQGLAEVRFSQHLKTGFLADHSAESHGFNNTETMWAQFARTLPSHQASGRKLTPTNFLRNSREAWISGLDSSIKFPIMPSSVAGTSW